MTGGRVSSRRAAPAVLVVAALSGAALASAAGALACGPAGYVYSGLASPSRAFGIRADVSAVTAPAVRAGHIAGWVGVGGPGEGPAGEDEWLQVGLSAFPNQTTYNLYYEVTVAGGPAAYHQLATHVVEGHAVDVAVMEIHGRPGWWRVWVAGAPRSQPIFLPGSDHRFAPMATTESWDGGTSGPCANAFVFRFGRVRVAEARGGGWHALRRSATIGDPSTVRRRGAAFFAAAGPTGLRMLGSIGG